MTLQFYAQPYDLAANGFYFETYEDFVSRSKALKNDYGELVEEFEIQFIDGNEIHAALFKALTVHQGSIGAFIEKAEAWEDWEKLHIVIAVGENGYSFDLNNGDPSDVDIEYYEAQSLKELAKRFVDDGYFGEIPDNLQTYIDYEAIAVDLSYDYAKAHIAGMSLVYRCS